MLLKKEVLRCIYKDTVVISFGEIDREELRKVMTHDAYDMLLDLDNNFWLGEDGRIYEFEYMPYEDEFIRVFENWDEFNAVYGVEG